MNTFTYAYAYACICICMHCINFKTYIQNINIQSAAFRDTKQKNHRHITSTLPKNRSPPDAKTLLASPSSLPPLSKPWPSPLLTILPSTPPHVSSNRSNASVVVYGEGEKRKHSFDSAPLPNQNLGPKWNEHATSMNSNSVHQHPLRSNTNTHAKLSLWST